MTRLLDWDQSISSHAVSRLCSKVVLFWEGCLLRSFVHNLLSDLLTAVCQAPQSVSGCTEAHQLHLPRVGRFQLHPLHGGAKGVQGKLTQIWSVCVLDLLLAPACLLAKKAVQM